MVDIGQQAGGGGPANKFVSGIRPPSPLDLQSGKVENWNLWKQQWKNYVIISKLDAQTQKYQTAMFLNLIGTEALRVYNGFSFTEAEGGEDDRKVDQIIKKFIVGQLNETYERYKFNGRQQATDESFDAYVTTLQYIRKSCNFCDCLADTLLRDQLVMGIRDDETRNKLLEISDLTLTRCIDLCRANEATGARMKQMNAKGGGDEVHGVRQKTKSRPKQGRKRETGKADKEADLQVLRPKSRVQKGVMPCLG